MKIANANLLLFATYFSPDHPNGFGVLINTKECWEANNHLCDHYPDDLLPVVEKVCEQVGLSEVQESTFEVIDGTRTITEVHQALLDAGVEFDPAHQAWHDSFTAE